MTKNVVLFFDGACTKNPGGIASFGYKISCKDTGTLIHVENGEVCRGMQASCNIAEWAAVTNGLRCLKEQSWIGNLEIYGDSQLVINQLNGIYKVRKDTLIPYYKECITMLDNWCWSAKWIPREKNEDCDRLSKNY